MHFGIDRAVSYLAHWRHYLKALGKWLVLALITGVACGLVGAAFHIGVSRATALRAAHGWLIFLLPIAGIAIVWLYRALGTEGLGTNAILDEVQHGEGVTLRLLPSIFLATVLTHLTGGSAGREGAALQMGGALGYSAGRLLRLDDRDMRTATMIGMAAFFTALFGTPAAATVFALEVISVGLIYHAALLPCLTASLTAFGITRLLGIAPEHFEVAVPALSLPLLLRVAVLSLLCALLSVLFCEVIHLAEHALAHSLPNPFIRAAAGGAALIALTLIVGTRDYNGAGIEVIARAVEGNAVPWAFVLKILFTVLTLRAGYKGGEIVPAFFVGATFGCVTAPLLGLSPGFAAALGLVAVFCGAVNCPLASIFLAVELFGAEGLLYYALVCALSFVLSGYSGLYGSQRILYDKLKARFIDVHTNAYHEGQTPAGGAKD